MMRAPLLIAHSMPAMICRVVASGDCRVDRREGVHRQDPCAFGAMPRSLRCDDDRAGHAGAVRMRLLRLADRVVLLGDRAGEIGMVGVDLGVDHRDQHLVAGRDLVDLGELQLLDDVLLGRSPAALDVSDAVSWTMRYT